MTDTCRTPLRVRIARIVPAPPHERRRGLLAWLTVEIGGLVADGFALRRSRAGRRYVAFPRRRDAEGRLHLVVWPVDRRDRRRIGDEILAQLDLGEAEAVR